jgi:hypothetical protein
MRKYKIIELLPVILLISMLVYTFILAGSSNIQLQTKHYAAVLFAVITLITYFGKRQYYKEMLAFTLVLGTINVLVFTPDVTIVSFGRGSRIPPLQLFSFVILLIFLFQNINRVSTVLGLDDRAQPDSTTIYLDEEKYEKLREKYSDRSVEELNAIISDSTYSYEAKVAAKSLLQEKEFVG